MALHETPPSRESWDITTNIGSTAVMVAAFRAVETARPTPVIRDKYARMLVSESGSPWERLVEPSMAATLESADPQLQAMFEHMRGYHATRTHLFDSFVTDALAAGIRQVVILASGLDSRAYRLDWPGDSTVYELDQPKVLAYKTKALATHHVRPKEERREVPVDLREDWTGMLRAAGFYTAAPTAWLTEGLLVYLSANDRATLFDRITALSAPGSRFMADTVASSSDTPPPWEQFVMRCGELGIAQTVDIGRVVHRDGGPERVAGRLRDRGWRTEVRQTEEAMRALDCWVDVPGTDTSELFGAFVTGVRE